MNGCFLTGDPEVFELYAAAKDGGYEWVSSPFYLDLALRKPTVA